MSAMNSLFPNHPSRDRKGAVPFRRGKPLAGARGSGEEPLPYGRGSDQSLLCRGAISRGAFILLEVVLAVALLLIGLTVIGAQVSQSLESSHRSEDITRIMMLTESKLAELDTGLVNFKEEADNEVEGDFTTRFPDYGWRLRFEETATEQLLMFTLEILYNPRESLEAEFEPANAQVVYSVHTMRAIPPLIDLEADFGFTEEQMLRVAEAMPPESDPASFDWAGFLRDGDLYEDILPMIPALMQAFGVSLEQFLATVPPEMQELFDMISPDLMDQLGAGAEGDQSGAGQQTGEIRQPGGEGQVPDKEQGELQTGEKPDESESGPAQLHRNRGTSVKPVPHPSTSRGRGRQ